MPKFDAVVIGAGNGGLAAACRMAMGGKKTLLIERHNMPGGCASSFRRGRFEFETALHELCEWGTKENPGGCRKTCEEFGLDIPWHMVPDNFRVITTASDGKTHIDATLPCTVKEFVNEMERLVPGCRKSIQDLFDLGTEFHAAGDYSLSVAGKTDPKYMQEHFPNFLRLGSYTVNRVFRAMKMPKLAQDIMNTYWGYLGVDADHLSFLQYVNMLWLYVNHGAWIPDKTSNELTTGLLECFRNMGGEVWMNCTATEILFDDSKAVRGVKTTCGEVETKHILCNMNQNMVYAAMCPPEVVPERMVKLGNARTYSARMFVVYLGLDRSAEELGIRDYTVFLPTSANTAKEYESGKTIATNTCKSKGSHTVNPLLIKLTLEPYNKPFAPARTNCDWLSRDEKQVDLYVNDKLCGFDFTAGAYKDFFTILEKIAKNRQLIGMRKSLPILITSGSVDPVGGKKACEKLNAQYKRCGINDVTLKLWENDRQEILNEFDKSDVYDYICTWLKIKIQN